jgi:hypothetical protein
VLPAGHVEEERERLYRLIRSGRLPISASNVELIPQDEGKSRRATIQERSRDADLLIVGFRGEALRRSGTETFLGYEGVGNVLFVNTKKEIEIVSPEEEAPATLAASAGVAPAAAAITPTPAAGEEAALAGKPNDAAKAGAAKARAPEATASAPRPRS